MASFRIQNASEQVATHLREQIRCGQWVVHMPGVNRLATDLEVARKTVEVALKQLEREGVLIGEGAGKRRKINRLATNRSQIRIGLMTLGSRVEDRVDLLDVQQLIERDGHVAFFSARSVKEIGDNRRRYRQVIADAQADAWIVLCGVRPLLDWFVEDQIPVFALYGRRRGLPIASVGPDKGPAIQEAVAQLASLGHRRIVTLCREERHRPELGSQERHFLEALRAHDIPTGSYNLPVWKDTPDGFREQLEKLFAVTPPTALIVDTSSLYIATLQFLAEKGIRSPEEVSLVATDPHELFGWCRPVAHIVWDYNRALARIRRWADHISQGRPDTRETHIKARLIPGETIGPAK